MLHGGHDISGKKGGTERDGDGSPCYEDAMVWNEPYLETCCRAALHRLSQVGPAGRPSGLVDQPCLERLVEKGFARETDGRFSPTAEGLARHASEILRKRAA